MKTPEDEAFDDLARRQGMWGGGFHAKRAAAADKQEPAQSMKVEGPHHVVCQCDKCKAQLAQPAQEPVAWEQFYPDIGKPKLAYLPPTKSPENACYTTPPKREWVGLTPEEINAVNAGFTSSSSFHAGALWAQAKLKEKNFD